jgi:hypothetical protein
MHEDEDDEDEEARRDENSCRSEGKGNEGNERDALRVEASEIGLTSWWYEECTRIGVASRSK